MSNTYIKKYDVGQIKLDLPYANYIHELPLLSFGDVQHTINLSLVFNYERKKKYDESFFIADGFKLNLQKRIGFDQCACAPMEFFDSNGKSINLICNGDNNEYIYTFGDDSGRILRKIGNTYEVEYPDFSKETYNADGRITAAYDKYGTETPILSYIYDDSRVRFINYRNTKSVEFIYDSLYRLKTIKYGNCTSTFNYLNGTLSNIEHYSGVEYKFTATDNDFTVEATDIDKDIVKNSVSAAITSDAKTITVSDHYGNSSVYNFYYPVRFLDKARMVEITNSLGVKMRLQYDNYGKLLYSYEANETDSDENDTMFVNGRYTGNVSVYRNGNILNTSNYTTYMLNEEIEREWFANVSDHVNQGGCYILTGWIWSRDYDTSTIRIGGTDIQVNCIVGQWVYFATKFANQYETISIATGIVDENQNYYEVKDLRVTYIPNGVANTGVYDDVDKEEGFIVCNGTAVSLSSAPMYYKSGSSYIAISGVTATDAIKYKLSKLKNINTTEVYYNKCKGVMKGVSGLFVLHGGQYHDVKCLEIRKKITSGDKEYVTAVGYDNSNILVESFVNNVSTGVQKLNMNLDVTETVSDGIKVTCEYASDSCGLISKQTTEPTEGADDTNTIIKQYFYDTALTKLVRVKDEFSNITEYITDSTWGVTTAVTFPNGSAITDSYDNDKCALLSRQFSNVANPRKTTFGYAEGALESIVHGNTTENITFDFGYENGKLINVAKDSSTIEKHEHTNTTLDSYYPTTESGNLYSVLSDFDKYGRLTKIDGVIESTYTVSPEYAEEDIVDDNGEVITPAGELINKPSNGSAFLAKSKDLTNNQVFKYQYNDKGAIAEITVVNSTNLNDKIITEAFEYDDLGRVTVDSCTYHQGTATTIASEITYVDDATAPTADGRVNTYVYKQNGLQKAMTTNEYDFYKRITQKNYKIGKGFFYKDIQYDRTRPSKVVDSKGLRINPNILCETDYEYDSMGRISSIDNGNPITYEYDAYGQLSKEVNNVLDKTFDYVYNGIGNILSVKTTPTGGAATTTQFTYGDTAYPDRLTKVGGKAITYDALGCPLSYDGKTFTWSKGKLASVNSGALPIVNNYTYTYDAYGRRVQKAQTTTVLAGMTPSQTLTGTSYTYDHSGRMIREQVLTSSSVGNISTLEKLYLYDESGVIGMIYTSGSTSTTYYFQRNIQGDVVAIYDTNGNKVTEYAYDAYGNCTILSTTNSTIANANPFRYRGYYYDSETGFYYLNARYYNPEWRRFISPDDTAYLDSETPNGLNLYCYCGNDPVNYADPSGHWIETVLDIGFTLWSLGEYINSPSLENLNWLILDIACFLTWDFS